MLFSYGEAQITIVIQVVNYVLRGWITNLESQGSAALPLLDDDSEGRKNSITRDLEFVRDGSKKTVGVRFFGSNFSVWDLISSFVKSRLESLEFKSP